MLKYNKSFPCPNTTIVVDFLGGAKLVDFNFPIEKLAIQSTMENFGTEEQNKNTSKLLYSIVIILYFQVSVIEIQLYNGTDMDDSME